MHEDITSINLHALTTQHHGNVFDCFRWRTSQRLNPRFHVLVGRKRKVLAYSPETLDELHVAGALVGAPINVVKARTVDLMVPAEAEIVIEGYCDTEYLEPEGPFGESHGHVALEEFNMPMKITAITPFPVWIGRRKVAGILVEAGQDFAIVGIGLNVNSTAFPAQVAEIATSLRLETGIEHRRQEVLAAIIRNFARCSRHIGWDFDHVLDSIRHRCVLTGQCVSLGTSSGPRHGRVEGIAPGGELLLRTESGLERLMQADEVRILD